MNACVDDSSCLEVAEKCAEKCEMDPDTDVNDWKCFSFCVTPSGNSKAISLAKCCQGNCPQKAFLSTQIWSSSHKQSISFEKKL